MQQTKTKHLLVLHAKRVFGLIFVFLIYISVGIGCPIYKYLRIRCPTCGVTRALYSLLLGDLEQYFRLNPFAILLVIAVVIGVHLSVMPEKTRKYGILYVVITAGINLCWYLYSFV